MTNHGFFVHSHQVEHLVFFNNLILRSISLPVPSRRRNPVSSHFQVSQPLLEIIRLSMFYFMFRAGYQRGVRRAKARPA